ncbi:MAG: helix-turn-helix domain-containing protein [Candidatus Dojkabacteria bacterium]
MITAGEILKNKRETLGKSLDAVAQETKIQKRFLQYVEDNEYYNFESEVFLTGFIKIYAKYLDLDTEKILALYRRSNPKKKSSKEKNKKKAFSIKSLSSPSPKTLIAIFLVLFSLAILGYVGFQIYKFQSPPAITVIGPEDNITVTEESITISGTTTPNTAITINDIPVEINSEGYFETNIKLNEGTNIVSIKGKKNSNNILETVATRKVTYAPVKAEEPKTDPNTEKENTITLEITDTPAWIKLDIDDKNELSQVVQVSKTDYPVENSFYLITGRVNNTKISFNGKNIEWRNSRTAGVAEMRCSIVKKAINCQ